jgi:hypothetical protein
MGSRGAQAMKIEDFKPCRVRHDVQQARERSLQREMRITRQHNPTEDFAVSAAMTFDGLSRLWRQRGKVL